MIDKDTLAVLREVSVKVKKDDFFEQKDEPILAQVLGIDSYHIKFIERLLSCVRILASEKDALGKKLRTQGSHITQLEKEVQQLRQQVDKQQKIMDTYNRSYLQRAKVKNGEQIAKKQAVTKAQIQSLMDSGLTLDKIAEKFNVSTSTIRRRLKENETKA